MCQEVHLSDVRLALLDYCDDEPLGESDPRVEELLAEFDDPFVEAIPHVVEHRLRADRLVAHGDRSAAHIHQALRHNMRRALRGRNQK